MVFPGRRIMGRSSNREGKESLLVKPDPSLSTGGGGRYVESSSAGSSSFEEAMVASATANQIHRTNNVNSRMGPANRFMPQHNPYGSTSNVKEEISPEEGVLQFVPAFDESAHAQQAQPQPRPANIDTSWDAILEEGAAAFPQQSRLTGAQSEVAGLSGSSSRFRRKAQSTVGQPDSQPHRSKPKEPRSKGKVARLASLFSSKESKTSSFHKVNSPQNTTDVTFPNSPSRSSSSGGYQNWPNTLNKNGDTVAIQPSYEENDGILPINDAEYEEAQAKKEMQEWMDSPAFQDISGVMPDPVGDKADDSIYFEEEHKSASSPVNAKTYFPNNRAGWVEGDSHTASPERSIRSKSSSAYFSNDVRPMAFPTFGQEGDPRRKQAAAGVMRRVDPQAPTLDRIALNNSLTPPHRTFHAENARGYRGLLDKTQEVPNLMDDMDSDSMSSSRISSAVPSHATGPAPSNNYSSRPHCMASVLEDTEVMPKDSDSDVFDEISKFSYSIGESEPFEGLSADSKTTHNELRNSRSNQSVMERSKATLREMRNTTSSVEMRHQQQNKGDTPTKDDLKVVLLGGGLSTIKTTTDDFKNRMAASDFDDCLTNSDIDQYGNTKLPSFQEMAAAGRGVNDSASVVDFSLSLDQSRISKDDTDLSFATFDNEFQRVAPVNTSASTNLSNESSYKDDESAFFSDFYSGYEVEFEGDLQKYYVQPSSVKALVRKYRKMCRATLSQCMNYDEIDMTEDEKKTFALFEMRSRIMEKDMERGLERKGGTVVVDDIVTTPYYRKAMRIRDAVIVSKAWRDGASPMDVINTARLTQRSERSYFIERPVWHPDYGSRNGSFNDPSWDAAFGTPQNAWEEVTWVDDTDFLQYSCPSLGPRSLRGTEMFTIGDCQSILLKLTNESCIELRAELNEATARQIEAEELMKEDGDYGDGMMTEAEMTYLTSMEEVKIISSQLVVVEKSFALVRDRIKNLVAKYESLLEKIDNEDAATSVVTTGSSAYSAYSSRVSTDFDQEERAWYRRQQRAELRAELAAREALLEKQSMARVIQEEKQRELRAIQLRLADLQSEPSTAVSDRQRSVVLAKAIATRHRSLQKKDHTDSSNQSTVDGVKQRFRDRMASRLRRDAPTIGVGTHPQQPAQAPRPAYFMRETPMPVKKTTSDFDRQKLMRSAGEEMFQHLDFYHRSLEAVESQRDGVM